MIPVALSALFLSLCGIFVFRNFAAQVLAIKVLFDSLACLFIIYRSEKPDSAMAIEAFAWMLGAVGMCFLFLFLAVAAKRFARSTSMVGGEDL